VGTRVRQDFFRRIEPAHGRRLGSELFRELEILHQSIAVARADPLARGLDVEDYPFALERRGHALARADQPRTRRIRANAHQDALARGPRLLDAVLPHVAAHLRIHPLGGAAQGELPQRDQVALAKELLDRAGGLLGHVHLALA